MSTGINQEVMEMVFRFKGAEDLKRARDAVVANEAAAESLVRAYLAGKVAEDDFARSSAELGAQLARSRAALERLEAPAKAAAAAQKQAAEEAKRLAREQKEAEITAARQAREQERLNRQLARQEARRAAREAAELAREQKNAERTALQLAEAQERATQAHIRFSPAARGVSGSIFELSRGMQDFAFAGFYGISNNVEGLAVAFSRLRSSGLKEIGAALMGPAGLIAGFTALTFLGPQAYRAIKGFADGLYSSGPPIDEVIAKIRELGEETDKAAAKAESAGKRVATAFRGSAATEAGRRFGEVLAESDWEAIRRDIAERGRAQQIATDPAIQRAQKEIADREGRLAESQASLQRLRDSQREADPTRRAPLWQVQQAERQTRRLESDLAALRRTAEGRRAEILAEGETKVEELAAAGASGNALARRQLIDAIREGGRGALAARLGAITPQRVEMERQVTQGIEGAAERVQGAQEAAQGWIGRQRQRLVDRIQGVRKQSEDAQRQQAEAEKQQEQAERERAGHAREATQQARADAAQFGGGIVPQAQAALIQGGDPRTIARQAAGMMQAAGLDASRAGEAAKSLVADAATDLQAQLAELRNLGFDRERAAYIALMDLQQKMLAARQQEAELMGMVQSIQQNQWQLNRQRPLPTPRLNRGR